MQETHGDNICACGTAIIWCYPGIQEAIVATTGKKHGFSKKSLNNIKARSCVCKIESFYKFKVLYSMFYGNSIPETMSSPTYYNFKKLSLDYQRAKNELYSQKFSGWLVYSETLEQFIYFLSALEPPMQFGVSETF